MDWELFSRKSPSQAHSPFKLRTVLLFKYPTFYYTAAILNVFLRLAWLLKVGMFYSLVDVTMGVEKGSGKLGMTLVAIDLSLKVGEVLRRWVWVYLRIEREVLTSRNNKE
jgi:hypothetical protein